METTGRSSVLFFVWAFSSQRPPCNAHPPHVLLAPCFQLYGPSFPPSAREARRRLRVGWWWWWWCWWDGGGAGGRTGKGRGVRVDVDVGVVRLCVYVRASAYDCVIGIYSCRATAGDSNDIFVQKRRATVGSSARRALMRTASFRSVPTQRCLSTPYFVIQTALGPSHGWEASHWVWSPQRHSAELARQTGASLKTAGASLADVSRRHASFPGTKSVFHRATQGQHPQRQSLVL